MSNIIPTKNYSWKIGRLADGCELCVKGLKSVLFVTGICTRNCVFCPISDKKKKKDVTYINERPVLQDSDIIEEVKLCSSKGVGITGGDPLLKLERTIHYIEILKKEFGKEFHIHLYTSLDHVNETILKQLYDSGLDEIRLHPELFKGLDKNLERINLVLKFDWDVGIEIPVIPGKEKETKKLIDFIDGKVKFLNLNELEYTEDLTEFGFLCKEYGSYAIYGSEEMAMELLNYCSEKNLNVHYCPVRLKDGVQLKNRIINRANNIKKWYDKITEDGMLVRGAIYLDKENKIKDLEKLKEIQKRYKDLELDENKHRLLTSVKNIQKLKNKLLKENLCPAIVEEYPTYDFLEVEVDFL
ncbi:MAG: radical SAM protein [Candidatus Nanoarchaeia archaeon]|nr:radical SAM protein [Candidatus Nanoarchaeia archaeon]MDD5588143.1 radical SAM protein [Candidatus Nanoarchaeia archaeon]